MEILEKWWTETGQILEGIPLPEEEKLKKVIRKDSLHAIESIQKNIQLELFMLIPVVLCMGIFYQKWLFSSSLGIALFVVPALLGISFLLVKYRLVKRVDMSSDLKSSLGKQFKILRIFMVLYQWIGILIIPLYAGAGVFLGFFLGGEKDQINIFNFSEETWTILAVVALIYVIGSVFFFRWYIYRLYGQHVKSIADCLSELEDRPS